MYFTVADKEESIEDVANLFLFISIKLVLKWFLKEINYDNDRNNNLHAFLNFFLYFIPFVTFDCSN